LYVERQVQPWRADDAIRLAPVGLSRLIEGRQLLIVVEPETLIRWHRKGIRAVLVLEVEAIRATAYAANLQRSDPAWRGSTGEPDEELTSTPASITPSRRLPRSAAARVQPEAPPASVLALSNAKAGG